jgi:hypothetical protein
MFTINLILTTSKDIKVNLNISQTKLYPDKNLNENERF